MHPKNQVLPMDQPLINQAGEYIRFTKENYPTIFKQYWEDLYVLAYRRLRDEDLAKDIVQEVFVYCWKQKDVILIKESLEAYLRAALQYQIIAHFRKEKIQSRAFSYLYERMIDMNTEMRDLLTEKALSQTLQGELEQMPKTMQEVFQLRIQDYSVDEIADSLNLAQKTVKNNITLGTHRLRKALMKRFPEDHIVIALVLSSLLL